MLSRPINCYAKHSATVKVIAAIANPVRWTILHTLFIAGPQQQKRLACYLQVTESVLSRHVKILREAHLVHLAFNQQKEQKSSSGGCHKLKQRDDALLPAHMQTREDVARFVCCLRTRVTPFTYSWDSVFASQGRRRTAFCHGCRAWQVKASTLVHF